MQPTPFESPHQLGALVRAARERAGLSQTELAGRAAVTRQWLVLLETGRLMNPTLTNVFKTTAALGLELQVAQRRPDDAPDLDSTMGRG